jgi:hypothetical protein
MWRKELREGGLEAFPGQGKLNASDEEMRHFVSRSRAEVLLGHIQLINSSYYSLNELEPISQDSQMLFMRNRTSPMGRFFDQMLLALIQYRSEYIRSRYETTSSIH